jgi:hypothetical protein
MLASILIFYRNGFHSMQLGRTLWKIIIVKLLILLAIIKLFFFPDVLKVNYDSNEGHDSATSGWLKGSLAEVEQKRTDHCFMKRPSADDLQIIAHVIIY